MALLAFLFLFIAPPEATEGTIFDSSGAAVAAGHIEISSHGLSYNASSDAAGHFTIEGVPNGTYTLRVTATGFRPYVLPLTIPSAAMRIELQVAPRSDEVIVTTTRVETPLSMLGVSASVLEHDDIVQQQNPTVYELLRDIPGMSVANTSRRGGTTSIYTRGGGTDANLMLVDGVQVNDPGGNFNFAHLTTANIDRIEVVRGPQSAVYGSNAAAAAVQMVSHSGTAEDGLASGYASFEGGTFTTYRYRAGLSGVFKALDYSWAGERLGTRGQYINDSYRDLTNAANFGYRLTPDSQVRFTFRTVGNRVGVPNRVGYGLLDPDAFRSDSTIISGARYERNVPHFSQRVQLGFNRLKDYFQDNAGEGPFNIAALVTGTPGVRGAAGVRLVRLLTPAEVASPSFTVPSNDRLVRRTVNIAATGASLQITQRRSAEYQANWSYSAHNILTFGYDYGQERGVNGPVAPLRNNHGLFANHQHSLGPKLFLTESVRLEDNSVFHKKATPRFAASYLLTPATRLKASAGLGISEPSFLETFSNDPTFVGNRNLLPERSRSFEAGIERHLFRSGLILDATLFDNRYRDLIVFVSLPPPQISTWINLEASRARGFESSAKFQHRWLRVRGQYAFLDTRVVSAAAPLSASTGIGQELPRRPRHSGAVDVTTAFRKGFVNLNSTFVGERQDSDGVGFGIVRNPRYQKLDLGGSYTIRPSIDLFVRVENLLNRRYEEVLGYTALSRNALAGMNVRWGHR